MKKTNVHAAKRIRKTAAVLLALTCAAALAGCGSSGGGEKNEEAKTESGVSAEAGAEEKTVVKVGVVGEYNAQWDTVNRALDDGEIDLNAFQHKAYLENDIAQAGYELTDIGDTIIAPLGIYNNKEKISSIEDIKDGDIIAIPSDLTNGGRALKLLEKAGLIECDPSKGFTPTKADITNYKVKIDIKEAESATLANLLPDCAAAIINGGNAYTAGLDPTADTIFQEDVNPETNEAVSQLVNVIVARTADKDNEVYQKVVAAYQTPEVEKTIQDAYKGAFICAWEGAGEEK